MSIGPFDVWLFSLKAENFLSSPIVKTSVKSVGVISLGVNVEF